MDVERIKRKYRRNARFYDLLVAGSTEALRRNAVQRLALRPGDRALDLGVHAILCFYTHDILLSPIAVPRALEFLVPGGAAVAAGAKLVHGWRGWLINPITVAYSLTAVTTRDVERSYAPFSVLEERLADFHVEERWLGSQYLASGTRTQC